MEKDIFMGVWTCFIISNQAGVSIWKAFTKTHYQLINKSFRNMPIYMAQTLCKIKQLYINEGTNRF